MAVGMETEVGGRGGRTKTRSDEGKEMSENKLSENAWHGFENLNICKKRLIQLMAVTLID